MEKQKITPYQHKLDLGEGPECHEAYQEYLSWSGYEDTGDRWVMFTQVWKEFEKFQGMMEKVGHPLQ